jgi:iron(III) transport system ATP-binding protein
MAELIFDSVSQSYATRQIIADLSFALPRGAIGCTLGPSCCGKTLVAEKHRAGMTFQHE